MKKIFFIFSLLISCTLFSKPIVERPLPQEALSHLMLQLNLDPSSCWVEQTQKNWLRAPGKEMWEMENLISEHKEYVDDWTLKYGICKKWSPSKKYYNKALILGATTPCMKRRLNFLVQQWKSGVRFNEIVWLTSDRKLTLNIDTQVENCKTETDGAKYIWQTADIPKEMRTLKITYIDTPSKCVDGKLKRATTADTIIKWASEHPQPCSALFVSNQPFCGYQYAAISCSLTHFPQILFEIIGEESSNASKRSSAVLLDSLARWIYVENQKEHHFN